MSARPRKRGRRGGGQPGQEAPKPSIKREDLEALTVADLKAMATELGIDIKELKKKDQLIDAVLEAKVKSEGFIEISGILDVLPGGLRLRPHERLPAGRPRCLRVDVGRAPKRAAPRRLHPRAGPPAQGQREVPGTSAARCGQQPRPAAPPRADRKFADLTPVYPDERLRMEHGKDFHDRAHHRPRRADREGPARPHRLAAKGRQDHRPQGHRRVHHREQPRSPPHVPARRRAP